MNGFQDVHRAETIGYVLGLVRDLHASETARVSIYSRQPYAVALEHIARDRAGRLEQLVHAIEAGLYDQLDTIAATTAITIAAIDATTTPVQVLDLREPEYYDAEEAAAVREIRREMAIEAGDDSEALRQEAEDDARHERAVYLAEREAYRLAEAEANDHHAGLGAEYSDGYALPGEDTHDPFGGAM